MKIFRELTKKQFNKYKKIFFWATIGMGIYYFVFTRFWLAEYLAYAGFLVALFTFILFKRHELYDDTYKDDEQKIVGKIP